MINPSIQKHIDIITPGFSDDYLDDRILPGTDDETLRMQRIVKDQKSKPLCTPAG